MKTMTHLQFEFCTPVYVNLTVSIPKEATFGKEDFTCFNMKGNRSQEV
jgi:hypothetical protein